MSTCINCYAESETKLCRLCDKQKQEIEEKLFKDRNVVTGIQSKKETVKQFSVVYNKHRSKEEAIKIIKQHINPVTIIDWREMKLL